MIYTAAISGNQSGSMLSQTNLLATGVVSAWAGDIGSETVFLNSGPMFHIGNFQFFGIPTFVHGGTNVVIPRVTDTEVLATLADEQSPGPTSCRRRSPRWSRSTRPNSATFPRSAPASPARSGRDGGSDDTSRFVRAEGGVGKGYGQTELTGMNAFCAPSAAGASAMQVDLRR